MIFQPCRVVGNQLEATYKLQMTGEILTYWAQQKLRVQCPDFGADLVAGLMEVHWKTRHGVPDVPVQEMYSELRQYICRSPARGGGTPLLFPSCALVNTMPCFPVDLHQPCHQVRTKVSVLNP